MDLTLAVRRLHDVSLGFQTQPCPRLLLPITLFSKEPLSFVDLANIFMGSSGLCVLCSSVETCQPLIFEGHGLHLSYFGLGSLGPTPSYLESGVAVGDTIMVKIC